MQSWLGGPFVESFSRKFAVFELAFIMIAVLEVELARSMENVCQKLSFVHYFLALGSHPGHFTLALHLRVNETTDVMPTIRPLEFSVALNLRVVQISSVGVYFFRFYLFVRKVVLLIIFYPFPFFVPFAIYEISAIKKALNLDGAVVALLDSLAAHLVLFPASLILRLVA